MMSDSKLQYAFVTPWFGPNLPGGAERAVRELVLNLCRREIHPIVLTTCARDFYHWDSSHPPGIDFTMGIPVHRFQLDERNPAEFDRVNRWVLDGKPVSAWEESIFLDNVLNSRSLCRMLWKLRRSHVFVFTPYMFGTTFWGTKVVADRSFLFPCLHDEPYLSLTRYRSMLRSVKGLLFYSQGESDLARRILGRDDCRRIVGLGVDPSPEPTAESKIEFRARHGLGESPFLYLPGRKQPEKNTGLAVEYFLRFKERSHSGLKLILSGPGVLDTPIPPLYRGEILDLGFLSPEEMNLAIHESLAVCVPSARESFSFTMAESWAARVPVLVNSECAATSIPIEDSGGGFVFSDVESFVTQLSRLCLLDASGRGELGNRGFDYAQERFSWDRVVESFLRHTEEVMG
jgi:glycosyltransferase involved in cell wall biosynthesis